MKFLRRRWMIDTFMPGTPGVVTEYKFTRQGAEKLRDRILPHGWYSVIHDRWL